jgi:hypothetical protein
VGRCGHKISILIQSYFNLFVPLLKEGSNENEIFHKPIMKKTEKISA